MTSLGTVTEIPRVYQAERVEYRLGDELIVWATPNRSLPRDVLWNLYLAEDIVNTFKLPGKIALDGLLLRDISQYDIRDLLRGMGDLIVTKWEKKS